MNWGGELFFLLLIKKNQKKQSTWVLLVFYPFWFTTNKIVTIVYSSFNFCSLDFPTLRRSVLSDCAVSLEFIFRCVLPFCHSTGTQTHGATYRVDASAFFRFLNTPAGVAVCTLHRRCFRATVVWRHLPLCFLLWKNEPWATPAQVKKPVEGLAAQIVNSGGPVQILLAPRQWTELWYSEWHASAFDWAWLTWLVPLCVVCLQRESLRCTTLAPVGNTTPWSWSCSDPV